MLRTIRVVLEITCFILITLLFLDFTGTLHAWFGWLAKIQLMSAVMAFNVGIVLVLVIVTLLFGRIYCSIICPLGVFQDIVSRIAIRRKGRNHFHYSQGMRWMRYSILAVYAVVIVMGMQVIVNLVAPYSAYGRMARTLLAPLWGWGNNLLAYFAERLNSYAFYEVDVWVKVSSSLVVAVITFFIVGMMAWRNGRIYCNTICPVGTLLGIISRYSLLKPVIDKNKCNGCKRCAHNCKSSCINTHWHKIDYTRCVACMDCLKNCKRGAIAYTMCAPKQKPEEKRKTVNEQINRGRRAFLSAWALVAGTALLKAQEKKVLPVAKKADGGVAPIIKKVAPYRESPIYPAGIGNARYYAHHCTACQLCVTVCPNGVLRPSSNIDTLMQPEMSYERGYCRPECVECTKVCPTGAIRPITPEEKTSIQIGHAVWIKENCIPIVDGKACDNCARHCPSGAIQMVPSMPDEGNSIKIPVVNVERCIGCGACENLCPSNPYSAIYVIGHPSHRII